MYFPKFIKALKRNIKVVININKCHEIDVEESHSYCMCINALYIVIKWKVNVLSFIAITEVKLKPQVIFNNDPFFTSPSFSNSFIFLELYSSNSVKPFSS